MDSWFAPLPSSIKTKEAGEVRVAVQVYGVCAEAMKTCKTDDVRAALACDHEANTDDDALACWSPCRSTEPTTTLTSAVVAAPPAEEAAPPPRKKAKKKTQASVTAR